MDITFKVLSEGVSPLKLDNVGLYSQTGITLLTQYTDKEFRSCVLPVKRTSLFQNYPNPFNPDTWIPYQLSEAVDVNIRIYDASSRLIRDLDLGHKPVGFYIDKSDAAYWDGRNEASEKVSSGIYFYTILAGEFVATKKMIVAR